MARKRTFALIALALTAAAAPAQAQETPTAPSPSASAPAPVTPSRTAQAGPRRSAPPETDENDKNEKNEKNEKKPRGDASSREDAAAPDDAASKKEKGASGAGAQESDAYAFERDALELMPPSRVRERMRTPQGALEVFLEACRAGNFEDAADVMDRTLLTPEQRQKSASAIAKDLCYVVDDKVALDWKTIPERPDGQLIGAGMNGKEPAPRRSILLARPGIDYHDVAIRLNRVKLPTGEPFWLFSAETVSQTPGLYAHFKPGWFERHAPPLLKKPLVNNLSRWEVLLVPATLLVGWLLGSLLALGLKLLARTVASEDHPERERRVRELVGPVKFAALSGFAWLIFGKLAKVSPPLRQPAETLALLGFMIGLALVSAKVVSTVTKLMARPHLDGVTDEDSVESRLRLTHLSVMRRVLFFVIFCLAVGVFLHQLGTLDAFANTLLGSAAFVGIVLGIAAKPLIGNLLAGVQVALTKPYRIGDMVSFAGAWGRIEDITYTYTVIRNWDEERVVVPFSDILSKPLVNLSRDDAHRVKPIMLHVDYDTDLDALRDHFRDLVQAHDAFDGRQMPMMQVFDTTEESVVLRFLCSAKSAPLAWDFHCYLREQLVRFIQGRRGRMVPHRRLALDTNSAAEVGRDLRVPAA